eukprot:s2686_g13.t5
MLWCPSPFAWPFACESPNERFRAIRPQLEAREPRESREPRPPEEAPEAPAPSPPPADRAERKPRRPHKEASEALEASPPQAPPPARPTNGRKVEAPHVEEEIEDYLLVCFKRPKPCNRHWLREGELSLLPSLLNPHSGIDSQDVVP